MAITGEEWGGERGFQVFLVVQSFFLSFILLDRVEILKTVMEFFFIFSHIIENMFFNSLSQKKWRR